MSYNSFSQHGVGDSAEKYTPKSTLEQTSDEANFYVERSHNCHDTLQKKHFYEINILMTIFIW